MRRELWALLAVQVLFATNAVVGRLNVEQLGPRLLVLVRVVAAAAIFAVLGRRYGVVAPRSRRDLALLALCALLGVVLNQILYLSGLWYSTATNASVIGTTIPVFTVAIAVAAGLERPSGGKLAGLAFALGGALILAHVESFRWSTGRAGDLCFLGNSLSYAGYLVLSRQLVRRYGAPTQIVWTFALGAIAILPFGLPGLGVIRTGGPFPVWLPFTVAYTILFPTVLAYFLSAFALRRVESSTAAAFIYLQPLVAIGLAAVVLGERPSARTGVASALIFSGVLLATQARRAASLEASS